jgi:hypothetical protein
MGGFGQVAGLAQSREMTVSLFTFASPFAFDPAPYCRDAAIKYTQRKNDDRGYQYDLSKDSLKKKLFSSMALSANGQDGIVSVIGPGPKFSPEDFARRAFKLPNEQEWVRTVITAVFG